MIEGIKSRPIYTELTPDLEGSRHILVGEGQGAEALLRFCQRWEDTGDDSEQPPYDIFYLGGEERRWVYEINRLARDAAVVFTHQAGLENTLQRKLVTAHMGTRLYVAGCESFIWTVVNIARAAGMSEDAMQKEQCGSRARPTVCVHCKTTQSAVTTNIYQCPGCGVHVFVRDHFSRRLGAYQAVCVDAENPGDLPEVQEVYR